MLIEDLSTGAVRTEMFDFARLGLNVVVHIVRLITASNPRTGCADSLEDIRTPADNDAAAEFIQSRCRV